MSKKRFLLLLPLLLATLLPAKGLSTRPILLFEIEEGFHEETIYRFRNLPAQLTGALERLEENLLPLTSQYDVAVLIYPVSLYKRDGWDLSTPGALDRTHPGLHRALEFFEDRFEETGIQVYLETVSSGIANMQHGGIYVNDPAPIEYSPEAPGVIGLSLDLQALDALRERYPQSIRGLRFHETHHSISGGNPGRELPPALVSTFSQYCADNGMKLVWNNSTWLMNEEIAWPTKIHYVDNGNYIPLIDASPWKEMQDDAVARLGSDLVFLTANNNYHPAINLYHWAGKAGAPLPTWLWFDVPFTSHPMKNYGNSSWGVSNQSWFWIEVQNEVGGRYWETNEMHCPEEIMISFSLNALEQGAAVVQFEPPWYLFRNGKFDTVANMEPRNTFLRLREALLDPASPDNPPSDFMFYFDDDLQRLQLNRRSDRPELYDQATLVMRHQDESHWMDFYNGKRLWQGSQEHRVPATFDSEQELLHLTRLDLSGISDHMIVTIEERFGFDALRVHEHHGRFLVEDLFLAGSNARGSLLAIAGGNLLQHSPSNRVGDPDELVFVRAPSGASEINVEINRINNYQSLTNFNFTAVEWFSLPITPEDFRGVQTLRSDTVAISNGLSPVARILIASRTAQDQARIQVVTADGTVEDELTIEAALEGESLAFATLDIDNDTSEEIVILRTTETGRHLDVYKVLETGISWAWTVQIDHRDPITSVECWMVL